MQRRLSVLLLVLALAAGAGLSSAEEPSIREYRRRREQGFQGWVQQRFQPGPQRIRQEPLIFRHPGRGGPPTMPAGIRPVLPVTVFTDYI